MVRSVAQYAIERSSHTATHVQVFFRSGCGMRCVMSRGRPGAGGGPDACGEIRTRDTDRNEPDSFVVRLYVDIVSLKGQVALVGS